MTHAEWIIETLVRQGVDTFCIAPGSRSTPLVVACANRKDVQTIVHFDERGVGFLALGLAKSMQKPVAIIVTSGTAIGNLMPAVMEAFHSHIPLILLTADRPPELRSNGANQSCDQVKFFGSYVRWQFDLPPDATHPFLVSTVALGVYHASRSKGPIQLNCMFREPFFSSDQKEIKDVPFINYAPSKMTLDEAIFDRWAEALDQTEKGVIIAGNLPLSESKDAIFQLAEKIRWPVLSDVLSNLRPFSIPYHEFFMKQFEFDAILHLGDRLVSKHLLEHLSRTPSSWYCLVADHPDRYDPLSAVTHRIECSPSHFAKELLNRTEKRNSSWLNSWQEYAKAAQEKVSDFFNEHSSLNEPYLLHAVSEKIEENWSLFIGNSMPIRDADRLFFPGKNIRVFANRGLSGIDGNIATAVGIARGTGQPLIAIIGDQAFLHDLNSLGLLKECDIPLVLLVVNNKGGGIFSFLPVREQNCLETHFANSHSYNFKAAAQLFGVPYLDPEDRSSFDEMLDDLFKNPRTALLEIATGREANFQLHQEMLQSISHDFVPT